MESIIPEINKIDMFFNEILEPLAKSNPNRFSIRNLSDIDVKKYFQIEGKLVELTSIEQLKPEEEIISLQVLEIKNIEKIT